MNTVNTMNNMNNVNTMSNMNSVNNMNSMNYNLQPNFNANYASQSNLSAQPNLRVNRDIYSDIMFLPPYHPYQNLQQYPYDVFSSNPFTFAQSKQVYQPYNNYTPIPVPPYTFP